MFRVHHNMKSSQSTLQLFVIVILHLIHISFCAVVGIRTNNNPGLYSPADDVIILTNDNFNASIYNSDQAWLIEFYSNWCGHCQRSVPMVKAFGTDIKGWNDLVVVGVLDCANEQNAPICEYFGITRYPTFRYIHEGYEEGPQNTGLPIVADGETNCSEHRKNLINVLITEQVKGRGKTLPNLQPFNGLDNFNMIKTVDGTPELAFVIIQEPGDDVGPSIILDFHKVKQVAIIYSFNNETNMLDGKLPALYSIQNTGDVQNVNISSPDRQGIKIAIRGRLLSRNITVPDETSSNCTVTPYIISHANITKDEEELMKKIEETGDTVFQLDLENALRYSLKREVGGNKEIHGEKLDALRKYINVLVKYFPFGEEGKSLLMQIHEYVNSNSVIDGHHINLYVKDADQPGKKTFSGPEQWLGCRGSLPTLRGYPCGLWNLLHYLTVNAAFDPTNTKYTNPKLALDAMRGYIKNFFGCEDCSNYFQEMAKRRRIDDVTTSEESVLWLWRAHNEVNQRLSGDVTEDPQHKKIQFPSKERCPQCYSIDGSWQEVEVLYYLKKMYSRENINYMGADPKILQQKRRPTSISTDS